MTNPEKLYQPVKSAKAETNTVVIIDRATPAGHIKVTGAKQSAGECCVTVFVDGTPSHGTLHALKDIPATGHYLSSTAKAIKAVGGIAFVETTPKGGKRLTIAIRPDEAGALAKSIARADAITADIRAAWANYTAAERQWDDRHNPATGEPDANLEDEYNPYRAYLARVIT